MIDNRLQSKTRRNLFKGAAGVGLVSVFQAWHAREALAAKPAASGFGPMARWPRCAATPRASSCCSCPKPGTTAGASSRARVSIRAAT